MKRVREGTVAQEMGTSYCRRFLVVILVLIAVGLSYVIAVRYLITKNVPVAQSHKPGTTILEEDIDSITVSTFELPPWGIIKDSNNRGITYDMADAIAKEAGLKIKNNIVPFPRFFRDLEAGTIDFGIMYKTKESDSIAESIGRTFVDPETIILPRKSIQIKNLSDLSGLTLGVIRGGVDILDERISSDKSIILQEYTSDIQGVLMLKDKRIDVMLSSKEATFYNIKEAGLSPSDFGVPFVLNSREGHIMFSKRSKKQHLKQRISAAIESLAKKGVFVKIRKQYVGY